MKKIGLLFWILGIGIFLQAQTSLVGKVTDMDTGEELIGASVIIYHNEVYVMGASTDFDGNYKVNLDPGIYDLELSYIGYPPNRITGIEVKAIQENVLDIKLEDRFGDGLEIHLITCCWCWCPPLIEMDEPGINPIIMDAIRNNPGKEVRDLIFGMGGVSGN